VGILGAAGTAAPWQRVPAMGAVTGGAAAGETAGDRWYCGPADNRRAYVVDDIGAVVEGGQGHVVRAERRSFAGDPVRYAGPVSLR